MENFFFVIFSFSIYLKDTFDNSNYFVQRFNIISKIYVAGHLKVEIKMAIEIQSTLLLDVTHFKCLYATPFDILYFYYQYFEFEIDS